MIDGPYVKLFIPYAPSRHNAAVKRSCPSIRPLSTRGVQLGRRSVLPDSITLPVLRCLAAIHQVGINGTLRPGLDFRFYQDPASGRRGIITYLATDSLPRGRNVISVMPVPPEVLPTDSLVLANAAWKRPYLIHFWR